MDDLFQLAQLALVVVFSAGILVAGRLFMRRWPIVRRALRAYLNNRAAPPRRWWRGRCDPWSINPARWSSFLRHSVI